MSGLSSLKWVQFNGSHKSLISSTALLICKKIPSSPNSNGCIIIAVCWECVLKPNYVKASHKGSEQPWCGHHRLPSVLKRWGSSWLSETDWSKKKGKKVLLSMGVFTYKCIDHIYTWKKTSTSGFLLSTVWFQCQFCCLCHRYCFHTANDTSAEYTCIRFTFSLILHFNIQYFKWNMGE